ncbi:hypothetical protein YSA_09741 [Pseudomonas putida ND6]|uniref:Uncharacterized protein n=1 Tax=Pseudomonas putida ND6 TaxID=231023 RepID=I3V2T6_PSEPU|nr:hypothetical protein YSA_09741 [Pseudomonas putida ND6]
MTSKRALPAIIDVEPCRPLSLNSMQAIVHSPATR